jgi:hypothetical protein
MVSSYYIGQTEADYKDIKFGTTNIGSSGCGICALSMVICRKANVTTVTGKKAVIQAIIDKGLSGNLLLNSSTISYGGKNYSISTTSTKPSNFNNTVVQYAGHFVLAIDNSAVEDPGTTSITTVSGANTKYGVQKNYWSVT